MNKLFLGLSVALLFSNVAHSGEIPVSAMVYDCKANTSGIKKVFVDTHQGEGVIATVNAKQEVTIQAYHNFNDDKKVSGSVAPYFITEWYNGNNQPVADSTEDNHSIRLSYPDRDILVYCTRKPTY